MRHRCRAQSGVGLRRVLQILLELEDAGMLTEVRRGRRNVYTVHNDTALGGHLTSTVGDLLRAFR